MSKSGLHWIILRLNNFKSMQDEYSSWSTSWQLTCRLTCNVQEGVFDILSKSKWWQASQGRDHLIVLHHPNAFRFFKIIIIFVCFYLFLDLVLSRKIFNVLCISSKYPQQHKTSSSLTSVYFPPVGVLQEMELELTYSLSPFFNFSGSEILKLVFIPQEIAVFEMDVDHSNCMKWAFTRLTCQN